MTRLFDAGEVSGDQYCRAAMIVGYADVLRRSPSTQKALSFFEVPITFNPRVDSLPNFGSIDELTRYMTIMMIPGELLEFIYEEQPLTPESSRFVRVSVPDSPEQYVAFKDLGNMLTGRNATYVFYGGFGIDKAQVSSTLDRVIEITGAVEENIDERVLHQR